MHKRIAVLISITFFLLLASCKTEFEKLRASGDVKTLTTKAFEYYEQEEYNKAQILFESILGSIRGKTESEKAYFYYAYTQYHQQKYILASFYFKDFSSKFLNSEFREEAEFMTAFSHYKLSPSHRLDQTYSEKSIEGFQLFVNTYPNSTRVEECNKLIDNLRKKQEIKAYAEGELYFNLKNYESAVKSFENLLKDFPETTDSEKVRYMIIRSFYLYAENSFVSKQPERFKEVVDRMEEFNDKYPKSRFSKEITTISKNTNKIIKELRNEGYQI